MKVIIGISHPKHVYVFRELYYKLINADHKVLILASEKEMTCELLDKFGMDYKKIGENQKRMIFKLIQAIKFFWLTLYYSLKFKPNMFLGVGYIHFALVSFLTRKPYVFIEDTEVAKRLHKILLPFTDSFLTTNNFKNKISSKQIRLYANLEMAYLHPKYRDLKKPENDSKYALLRFVSWEAFHDAGHSGLSNTAKLELVSELSKYMKVYIASEKTLTPEFEKYKLNIPSDKIHEFVEGASLIVGESPTMTTEAAILGTPAICISSWACELGNFEELIERDLIYCYTPADENMAIQKAVALASKKDVKIEWNKKAEKFVSENIDLSCFLFWFVLSYPESHNKMKENPDYQLKFK